jgi:hypothetical protein
MPKRETKEDPAEQLADFKRLAKEIGADEARGSADRVMKRLAQQKRRQPRARDKDERS